MPKNHIKKSLLILLGLALSANLFAQTADTTSNLFLPRGAFRTWSIGFNGGILSQNTIFLGTPDFKEPSPQPGYGFYIKKQLAPSFGLQINAFGGKLHSSSSKGATGLGPYANFTTQINYAASMGANFILTNINWRSNERSLQLYATLNGGIISYVPTVTAYDGTVTKLKPTSGPAFMQLMIPVSLGLKWKVASGVNIDIGYVVNFVDADDLDGYQFNGNNDRFSYSHLGIEFAIGRRSKPQLAGYNPQLALRKQYAAGINSLQKQIATLKSSSDSVLQQTKALAATVAKTTADSDGDGVPDEFDKCPNTPKGTKVDGSGCPLPPAEIKYVYVTKEDKKVVAKVIETLEFDLMKSTIRPSSYPNLDSLANLLRTKNIKLKLDGYTDNTGPDWRNLALSKNRALAIKNYLIKKGANSANIEAEGHGNENPKVPNDTLEGRKTNRRVEFTLLDGIQKE